MKCLVCLQINGFIINECMIHTLLSFLPKWKFLPSVHINGFRTKVPDRQTYLGQIFHFNVLELSQRSNRQQPGVFVLFPTFFRRAVMVQLFITKAVKENSQAQELFLISISLFNTSISIQLHPQRPTSSLDLGTNKLFKENLLQELFAALQAHVHLSLDVSFTIARQSSPESLSI